MKYLRRFFNSKKKQEEVKPIEPPKPFNIDEFNDWFNNEYDGYDGRRGAPGIFLRTDKLSNNMIVDYFKKLGYNQNDAEEQAFKHYDVIRKDWRAKLANR
jgi:hypothetical protein